MTDQEWQTVGRRVLAIHLHDVFRDFETAYQQIINSLEDGEDPNMEDLRKLRAQRDELQAVVEEDVATITEGADPWENATAGIPYGALSTFDQEVPTDD